MTDGVPVRMLISGCPAVGRLCATCDQAPWSGLGMTCSPTTFLSLSGTPRGANGGPGSRRPREALETLCHFP